MSIQSVGFVGGGRITYIILQALTIKGKLPASVVVSDIQEEALAKLKTCFPTVDVVVADNAQPARQQVVFLALHPPAMKDALKTIGDNLQPEAIVVSLSPKLTTAALSEMLGGFSRIARMIPNAPSIVAQGFNPLAFHEACPETVQDTLITFLGELGVCPQVDEDKLEAYAILSAMGPTYLWFQLYELQELGLSFGLTYPEIEAALTDMVKGTVSTMYQSGLTSAEVMDLIPAKPLGEAETEIRQVYRSKLLPLYDKLSNK